MVNVNFLQSIGINDLPIINQLTQYNKASARDIEKVKTFKTTKEWSMNIPSIPNTELNRLKLKYMQDRLGINFTYRSLEYLRVVFSLKSFLSINYLSPNKKFKKMTDMIDKYYIGFLSSSRDLIIFRDFTNKMKIRYIKYNLTNYPAEQQMYMIPNQIDPMEDEVTINIAEGTFDILGIFFHVRNRELKNQIYIGNGGSAFQRVLEFFIKKGFMSNLIVNIYSDGDKGKSYYKDLISKFTPWVKEFHLYYNTMEGEKDCGVPGNRIRITEAIL